MIRADEPLLDASRTLILSAAPIALSPAAPESPPRGPELPLGGQAFLDYLLREQLVFADEVAGFLDRHTAAVADFKDADILGHALVTDGLLTRYQLQRIMVGNTHGLVIGNYRILEKIGGGGMGVVYRGEHLFMRRSAAIKVLPVDEDCPDVLLRRFYAEMRVLAGLHHENIVLAYDAGKLAPPSPGMPTLLYLAMELVNGHDLHRYVSEHGRVPMPHACEWIRQAACGLQEAHNRHVIHRDVKPSNLLLTADGQIKLSDFGLVRQFSSRLTDPKALLGTLDFMAPEQSIDPTNVGSAADIFGLGATLFWLLTGTTPFPRGRSMSEAVRLLQESPPRRLGNFLPEAPKALQELVDRLLDRDPTRRPALPSTVSHALAAFVPPAPHLN